MGEIHKLRVKSPYELMKIVDIKIENKPNEHGYLYLKCLIDENINFNSTIKASTEDQIIVYEELEDTQDKALVNINEVDERNSKRLFNGLVQNMRTTNISGIYYLEIQALTSSIKLDIEKKSRSFQNVNMTYNDLINNMLSYYPGYGFAQYAGKGERIGKPLFQYKETDWEFLKRIASELNLELYCDIINLNFMFNFGIPDEHIYELEDNISYDAFKDLKSFHKAGGYNAGYDDTDYFYYEVRIRDILEIGSEISYKQKELYVREYEAYKEKEEIFYKYKLCREKGVWQGIIYNKLLKGATLEGEVLAVQNEQVKLHLNIDESQDEGTAHWFNYAPPSVNIMYSMPLVGEYARLYFSNEETETPIVTGCIRKNGDTCEGTADTTNRYLHTEYGSEIALLPGALNIKGGSETPLSINLEDETGVTLTSPNGLNLNAGGEIVISTPNNINISAQSQILMTKGNTSGVSIEGDLNFSSGSTINNGSDDTSFSKYADDEPQAVQHQKSSKEEQQQFDVGSLISSVQGGLAQTAFAIGEEVGSGKGGAFGAMFAAIVIAAIAVAATVKISVDNNLSPDEANEVFQEIFKTLVGAYILNTKNEISDLSNILSNTITNFNNDITALNKSTVAITDTVAAAKSFLTKQNIWDWVKGTGSNVWNDFFMPTGLSGELNATKILDNPLLKGIGKVGGKLGFVGTVLTPVVEYNNSLAPYKDDIDAAYEIDPENAWKSKYEMQVAARADAASFGFVRSVANTAPTVYELIEGKTDRAEGWINNVNYWVNSRNLMNEMDKAFKDPVKGPIIKQFVR